jgi:hypothetical protein
MHRKFPKLGGLALGLVLLAAAAMGSAAEYSGATLPGLASRDAAQSAPRGGEIKTAQTDSPSDADAEARKRLKQELDRMRRARDNDSVPTSPKPVKKTKEPGSPSAAGPPRPQPAKQPVHTVDPEINRVAGKLIILHFSGTQPSDGGPKAIHALLHEGLIAGVMFRAENIQSRAQLKELMKFLWPGGPESRPMIAIGEIGGPGDRGLPRIPDFEAWPSEQEVASKGDPEYAYSTYRSLSTYLAALGFTMNFGPALGTAAATRTPSASFGSNPLQAGVFAKTFMLGHKDAGVIAVPIVDNGEIAVRALKTLLVSNPGMPVAANPAGEPQPFAAYEGLVRGARFCLMELSRPEDAALLASNFERGCDVLVVDGGRDSPAAVRDGIVQGISDAIKHGTLSLAALNASAQKVLALLSPPPAHPDGFTTRTSR